MENGRAGKTYKINFKDWNGKGEITPVDFEHDLKITDKKGQEAVIAGGTVKVAESAEAKLEKKFDGVMSSIELFIDEIEQRPGEFINEYEIGTIKKDEAYDRASLLLDNWAALLSRFEDNKERSTELLEGFEQCQKEIEKLKADIEIWKEEKLNESKKEEEKMLDDNKGWEQQFEKAIGNIEEFNGSQSEFDAKYSKTMVDSDFDFDLKERLAQYLERFRNGASVFGSEGSEAWRKILAAAKMINNDLIPKKFVLFAGRTIVVDDMEKISALNKEKQEKERKEKKEKFKNKIRSTLGNAISAELKQKISQAGIENAYGAKINRGGERVEFLDSSLFFISEIVAKELFEDEAIIDSVIEAISNNNEWTLGPDEIKRVNLLFDESLASGEMNRAVFLSYVYNEAGKKIRGDAGIGKIIAKWRKANGFTAEMTPAEKRDIDHEIMLEFAANKDIEERFVEARKSNPAAHLDGAAKKEVDDIIREFVKRKFKIDEAAANDGKERERQMKLETAKSHNLDALVTQLHGLVDEFEKRKDELSSEESKALDDFFEEINVVFHELHEANFDNDFRRKSSEVKQKIKDEELKLSNRREDTTAGEQEQGVAAEQEVEPAESEVIIDFEKQLTDGNLISRKLVDSWARISDYERESPEFEWIYRTLDIDGNDYFKNEFERIRANEKLTDQEKSVLISKKISYLENMNDRIERIMDIKQTAKDLGSARKEFDEIYSRKSEVYKEVLAGLNNKSKYEELMAKDGDIEFYFKEYQKTLEKYLEDCFEKTEIQTDLLIEKIEKENLNPGAIEKHWKKIKDKITPGFFKKKVANEVDLLNAKKAGKVQPEKTEEEKERMKNFGFEYEGGFDQLRRDLLILMNSIMKTEKDLRDFPPKNKSKILLRDMQIVDLMKKDDENFKRLPKEAQDLLKKMFEAAKAQLEKEQEEKDGKKKKKGKDGKKDKDKEEKKEVAVEMTVRELVTKTMTILKSSR